MINTQPAEVEPPVHEAGDIRFQLYGQEHQILLVDLSPGDAIKTENGAMAFRDQNIVMATTLGRGRRRDGFFFNLFRAFRRKLGGESFTVNIYTNKGDRTASIALSPKYPSHIRAVELGAYLPDLICRRGAYLAGSPDVIVDPTVAANIFTPIIAKTGFILQKLTGHGVAFIAGNGVIIAVYLEPGQTYRAELDAILAWDETISYKPGRNRGVRNILLGGEGFFVSTFTGPGYVYYQSTSHFQISPAAMRSMVRALDRADTLKERR